VSNHHRVCSSLPMLAAFIDSGASRVLRLVLVWWPATEHSILSSCALWVVFQMVGVDSDIASATSLEYLERSYGDCWALNVP